jgi:protein gp37
MAENSKIEWTNHTANLWWGCTEVHAGCTNCYAELLAKRYGKIVWGNDNPRRMIKDVWSKIEKFQKEAKKQNEVHRVFVGSMMDIFEKPMPLVDHKGNPYSKEENEFWNTGQLRDKFLNEVVPNSPNLMFLLLTKRPSNINKYIPKSWKENPPKNVMFGTSPVDQETANKLIVQLSKVNGQRFLSVEPQLEKIDLMAKVGDGTDKVLLDLVDWVINGGESGPRKRPFDTDWGRLLRNDCKKKGVPFFFKQIDKVKEIPNDLMIREFPTIKNETINLKKSKMKIEMAKLKSVTVKELRVINENSTRAKFNRTFDIDGLVNDGILSDIPDFAYSVQLCMVHENQDGSIAMRVYIGTNTRLESIIMDMTPEDYDNLFQMKFKVVA